MSIHLNSIATGLELLSESSSDNDFPQIRVKIESEGKISYVTAEAVLVASGRRPNVEGMNLDIAGV